MKKNKRLFSATKFGNLLQCSVTFNPAVRYLLARKKNNLSRIQEIFSCKYWSMLKNETKKRQKKKMNSTKSSLKTVFFFFRRWKQTEKMTAIFFRHNSKHCWQTVIFSVCFHLLKKKKQSSDCFWLSKLLGINLREFFFISFCTHFAVYVLRGLLYFLMLEKRSIILRKNLNISIIMYFFK